nr:N-6 DNA methylase [Caldilineaceae bacterium]
GNGGEVGDFDVVLANPPFTGNIDKSDIGESLRGLDTSKTELLFVELILQLLRTGGRAAVIVPEGLLFGSTRAHRTLRQKLVKENQLNAVISLPGGVFQPYTGVKTSLLLFNRDGSTDEVWFYEVGADGLTLNAKRSEQYERNDLWDLTLKYRLRYAAAYAQPAPAFVDGETWRQWQAYDEETRRRHYLQPRIATRIETDPEGEPVTAPMLVGVATQSIDAANDWVAEQLELTENDLNLSAGRYKPFELEAMQHDPPIKIIRDLQEIEDQIRGGLSKLLELVEHSHGSDE